MANRIPPAAAPKLDIVPLGNYGTRICPKGYAPEGNAHTGYVRCESQDYIDRTSAVGVIGGTALITGAPFVAAAALDSSAGAYAGTAARRYVAGAADEVRAGASVMRNPAALGEALGRGTVRGLLPVFAAADLAKDAAGKVVDWVKNHLTHGTAGEHQ